MTDCNELAPTPPMGWNSFDCFGPWVREEEVKANADYLASNLRQYGWEYIVVDIGWYMDPAGEMAERSINGYNIDEYGRSIPSAPRFPSSTGGKGLKPVGDYIHGKGLKFGIHIMRGIPKAAVRTNTPILNSQSTAADIADTENVCPWWEHMYGIDASKEGAQEYCNSIIRQYAEWGVDFLKVDDISKPYHKGEIELVRAAIDGCGRDIALSLSPGPTKIEEAGHVATHAQMWRLSSDVWDRWEDVKRAFDYCEQWNDHRTSGRWPDLDMLPFGRLEIRQAAEHIGERWSRLTHDEQIAMMTLWVVFRSPLMMGGHLPANDEWTLSVLTNQEVLDITKNGRNNRQVFRNEGEAAWMAEADGCHYVALFNLKDGSAEVGVTMEQLGLSGRRQARDLWLGKDTGAVESRLSATLPAHSAKLFKLTGGG